MSWQRLLPPAIVLALGLAGIWLLYHIELVPERTWVGFQGEAKRNPWYAAERLVVRMDGRVHAAKSVPALRALPADGVLFLPRRLGAINRDEQLKLLQWVEGGGHLIVEAEAPRQSDPILDALGVKREMVDNRRHVRFAEAMLPGAAGALKVEVGQGRTLQAKDAAFALKGRDATWLVHFTRGAGRVTALTDLNFAGNLPIRHFDHAEFLWQLTRLAPRPGAVAFFHSPVKLSLLAWLLEHAWAVLAATALLLTTWLWRIVPRFGPVAPDPEPARRRLLDHLRASGRFQWAGGGGRALAEAARDAALRRLLRAQPDFASLDEDARIARLVAQFGLTPEGAHRVLRPVPAAGTAGTSGTAADLLAATSVYQSIHEQLMQTRGRR